MTSNNFAVFILTHGRPDNIITYHTLLNAGYDGKIYLLIDDLDPTKQEYINTYGDKVVVFSKKEYADTFDIADNFNTMRGVVYARNALFDVAKKLGIKYFIALDDDYTGFYYRFSEDKKFILCTSKILRGINKVFKALLEFLITANVDSIAIAQNGDFIGGINGNYAKKIFLSRKCMNLFVCSTERPFQFVGRINEDVNTYTYKASIGLKMFTINYLSLKQTITQTSAGGMTDLYLDYGTYVKSFYSVIFMPSSVKVEMLNSTHKRLHHSVKWRYTVPKILSEDLKKQ